MMVSVVSLDEILSLDDISECVSGWDRGNVGSEDGVQARAESVIRGERMVPKGVEWHRMQN